VNASWWERLRAKAREIKRETYTLYFACRDPRTPWYAKVFAGAVVAYAASPIDLIPDFVPVLGYLDDLVLVPLGVILAMRMIPEHVLLDCRERARLASDRPTNRVAAVVIVAVWVAAAITVGWLVLEALT
jgi:uncharacterized membrane protein YkvA (DUF1232 family)